MDEKIVKDCISRRQAVYVCLELIHERRKWLSDAGQKEISGIDAAMCAIQDLPSAQPKSYREGYQAGFKDAQPKCAKDFVMLKVIDLNGRPYYSIIYLEDGREYEGYSSYDLKVISEYLKRYFGFAQPEHLTDDDFETIRIHLSAFKEGLCNQGRWKEAEEYERLINRFMSFASAQPEIIRCRECKYGKWDIGDRGMYCGRKHVELGTYEDFFCAAAERREVSE